MSLCLIASGAKNGNCSSQTVLQVATALHLGAAEFLSFDSNQRKLAAAEGLPAKP